MEIKDLHAGVVCVVYILYNISFIDVIFFFIEKMKSSTIPLLNESRLF